MKSVHKQCNQYMKWIRQPVALFAYAKNPPEQLTSYARRYMSKGERMKIKLWIVILIVSFFNSTVFAESKYSGRVLVNLKEVGGNKYTSANTFETLVENVVIIY